MRQPLLSRLGTPLFLLVVLSAFTLAICRRSEGSDFRNGIPGDATICGRVSFKGKPPENALIDMTSRPSCANQHPDGMREQAWCVGADGGFQWVLVSVVKGDEVIGKKWPTPEEPVTLDQKGCCFRPHVFGMMASQPILIANSDPCMHNIDVQPSKSRAFNDSQGAGCPPIKRTLERPEAWVAIKCDVHGWMRCFCGVFSHPYFAVSDAKGTYSIEKLPAGRYVLRAQHEKAGKIEKEIEVKDGEKATLDFEFPAK